MSDLIWSVIRKHNAFKVGSRHETATFSTEPGNLTGRHNLYSSGLTRAVAIDVVPLIGTKKGAYGTTIKVRSTANVESKPSRQWTTYRTKGADKSQRIQAKRIAIKFGRDKKVQRLVQIRVAKVLRGSYRKKLARATFRFNKRQAAKAKLSQK